MSLPKYFAIICMGILLLGYCLPYKPIIPVANATNSDWNPKSYWAYPWGKSVAHKGIDIFANKGKAVLAATSGVVIYSGYDPIGGNIIGVLGPKWRISYYAHLHENLTHTGQWVNQGKKIGSVGDTGNAAGKPPHLHYALITPLPYPWRYDSQAPHGSRKMFYLKPDDYF
jgi:murein DD-endopeptidase MepM/ murein hydrolase activator NlpD